MTRRFPLYLKILFWFFLNLLLLAVAFYFLLRNQLRFGIDWLLSGSASDRIEAVSEIITADLNERPRAEWNDILKRFGDAYQMQFLLYRNDGIQLAGETNDLPKTVRERLLEHPRAGRPPFAESMDERAPRRRRAVENDSPDRPPRLGRPMAGPPEGPAEVLHEPRSPRPKFMVHTKNPTGYWVFVRTAISEASSGGRIPATLLAMSHSIRGGGLFFDVTPWIAVGLGAVVFSALFWLPLVHGITRSIGQLTHATRQIAEGRFHVRVDEARRDELGALGHAVNQMAARLAGLVSGQKRFLGDVAHELCSPLAKLRVALGILEERLGDNQQTHVKTANEKAAQMASLVNELLSFSKASLGVSSIKLQATNVHEAAEKAAHRESIEGVSIQIDAPDSLQVVADPELLVRALSNLLRNAVRYAGQAGPILLAAKQEGSQIVVTVADHGPGVPENELDQIFDPFYRVDTSRDRATGGVGLGLAIVKTCIESCHGSVACRNRAEGGFEVTIELSKSDENK
jgi:two-component system sensor histidine kinase CpxA